MTGLRLKKIEIEGGTEKERDKGECSFQLNRNRVTPLTDY